MNKFSFRNSLRTRLSLSYIFVACTCVLLIIIITNVFMEKQFKVYTINNQEQKNKKLAELIGKQYNDKGLWNSDAVENIGINAIEQGMVLKVSDSSGKVIWDASVHNNGLCKQMLDQMMKNMTKYNHDGDGKYEVKAYPIYFNKNDIAKVEIGYYGPVYYNNNDIAFIATLNRILLTVGIISLFFALLLGGFMGKWLSTPITRVVRTAENISKGYFDNRVMEKSTINEIGLLISTINNLAESLEKQEILRKRMSADVAHELRTPLASLQSHMEAMIDGIWKPDTERLESCHEEIMRIIRLVGDLENLAKYESENHKLNRVKFDVSEQIQKIIHNFQADFNNKNIRINFIGNKEEVIADKDRISQVIINLLSNALKYTPQNGQVEVNVQRKEEFFEIKVKDTGTGISAEDLPYVFERFYRADRSRNRLTGGSGIGLAIAKAIVDSHKGKISVRNSPDSGAEFIVAIPKF